MQLTRTMGVIGFARRASAGVRKKLRVSAGVSPAPAKRVFNNPIWVYRVTNARQVVLPNVAGVKISSSWSDILEVIGQEQGRREPLKVVIYPCAPLVSLAN